MESNHEEIRIKSKKELNQILEKVFQTQTDSLRMYSRSETAYLFLQMLTGMYALRFFLNHFNTFRQRLEKSLNEPEFQRVFEFARQALQFYRQNAEDHTIQRTTDDAYEALNYYILGNLTLLYVIQNVEMNGSKAFNASQFDILVLLQSMNNNYDITKSQLRVRINMNGLLDRINYVPFVGGLSYSTIPLPFYDPMFIDILKKHNLETYHFGELFIEEPPRGFDVKPSLPIALPTDQFYTAGVLSAIFHAFPSAEIVEIVDTIREYLLLFLEDSQKDDFEKKCQIFMILFRKLPNIPKPMSSWDISRHLQHMTKHVFQFRKGDLKKIAKKTGCVDYDYIGRTFVISDDHFDNKSGIRKNELSYKKLREYSVKVLERPILKIGKLYFSSSLLLLNSFMHFIQTIGKRSAAFGTRKGFALEACFFSMIRVHKINKLIILKSSKKEAFSFTSWRNLQSIKSESSKWNIPIEEIIIPNLSRPYMEFDLVLEDNDRSPLFIEIKAKTFSAMEYALGRRWIRNQMFNEHKKLREKLVEVSKHPEFQNRFGSVIEGLLVSQDSVFSIGYLDLIGKNPVEAYENFRNLVHRFGVTLDGFGNELVICFQLDNSEKGSFDKRTNTN